MLTTIFGLALIVNAATIPPVSTTTNEYAKSRVLEEFKDIPSMIDVAYCESGLRQFEGTSTVALKGNITPKDRGIFQINEGYHLKRATEMGLDILTVDGNIAYAKVLYLESGLQSWKPSHSCMDKRAKLRQESK